MLLQQSSGSEIGNTLLRDIIYYLNYPFINQEQFKVSLLSLIILVILLAIVFTFSYYIRKILNRTHFMKQLDTGLRFTLLQVLHYLIITMGFLYGLKVGFNINLTGIAVVLGFLSVGIGFGLQNIASDLVSGFILLFERPVRVGDRLKIGDTSGRVDNIQLRTTLLITNDNIAVIVPNSDLVKNQVINWSYGSQRIRLRVPVGVAYGSDIEKVKQALIEAGKSVSDVIKDPPPGVHLREFGDSSINFHLLVWIDKPHNYQQITSNVNFAIARTFREHNIEIPFPQRDLHIRSGPAQLAN